MSMTYSDDATSSYSYWNTFFILSVLKCLHTSEAHYSIILILACHFRCVCFKMGGREFRLSGTKTHFNVKVIVHNLLYYWSNDVNDKLLVLFLFCYIHKMLTGILSYRLMTNGVMAKYNMHEGGQHDKLLFKTTKLCHVIKCKKLRLI